MFTIFLILSVLAAVLLIVAVLMQSSKGGGLAGTFGGASANVGAMFGTRRTADFLSKITWWLAGFLVVSAILINLFFLPGKAGNSAESIIQGGGKKAAPTQPSLPPAKK